MDTTWWLRGAAMLFAGGGAALLAAGPAWADTNAVLRSGQSPVTAAGYPVHGCDKDLGGGPYTDRDVWSFVLPDKTREFISVTAYFDTTGDGVSDATVSADGRGTNGASKAWLAGPAGSTLLTATAVVSGTASGAVYFNIARTCPAIRPTSSSSPQAGSSAGPSPGAGVPGNPGPSRSPVARVMAVPSNETGADGSQSESSDGSATAEPDSVEVAAAGNGGPGSGSAGSTLGEVGGGVVVLGVAAFLVSVAGAGAWTMFRRRADAKPTGRHHRLAG